MSKVQVLADKIIVLLQKEGATQLQAHDALFIALKVKDHTDWEKALRRD